MLQIQTNNRDINGDKLPNGEVVKEYTITQGDTFTLKISDPNDVLSGARFKLGYQNYSEYYVQDFEKSTNHEWVLTVQTTDSNNWAITNGNPYIYEIEGTMVDGNKISITKYYFNVDAQVGDD